MDYQLYAKGKPSQPLASAAFDDDFAADSWARNWAKSAGTGEDYLIERADGKSVSLLFRTNADQWYIMRR